MDDPARHGASSRNRGRAARRHQRSRMIARARRAVKFMFFQQSERETFARKVHDHLAACSCWMCGNPRRFHGEPTVQERRATPPCPPDAEPDR